MSIETIETTDITQLQHKVTRLQSCVDVKRQMLSIRNGELHRAHLKIQQLEVRLAAVENTVKVVLEENAKLQQSRQCGICRAAIGQAS